MDYAAQSLVASVHRLLVVQAAIALIAAAACMVWYGPWAALSATFGGVAAMVNAWFLGGHVLRADRAAQARAGTTDLLVGAAQRFVVTLSLFALGIGVLSLPPGPLLLAFAFAQLAYAFNRYVPQGRKS